MNGSSSAPSRLAQRWMAIANALDLRVIAPASILLPSGQRVDADALLPGFGGPRGMLLVTDDELVWTHRVAIVGAGYGFSVLSDPGPRADVLPSWMTSLTCFATGDGKAIQGMSRRGCGRPESGLEVGELRTRRADDRGLLAPAVSSRDRAVGALGGAMIEKLSKREAYAAMFAFLEEIYQRTESADIGALLGGMSLLKDGGTADPPLGRTGRRLFRR